MTADRPIEEGAAAAPARAPAASPEAARAFGSWTALSIALGLVALGLAWHLRFVQDDAFISYAYARSLVEGSGLTWFGTRVEGYTNFLWVIWIALGLPLGVAPVAWSYAGGLAALAGTLVATIRCARALFGEDIRIATAVGILTTNYSFLSYATGGLETMGQTATVTAAAAIAARAHRLGPKPSDPVALALLVAFGVMLRMDTAVALLPIVGFGLWRSGPRRAAGAMSFAVITASALGCWLGWKWFYYGSLVPNSFHAKVALSASVAVAGLVYVGRFLQAYWFWLPLGASLLLLLARRQKLKLLSALLWVPVLAWTGYVVAVGGDFMEFRFMVPVIPLLALLVADAVCTAFGWRPGPVCWAAGLTLAVLAGASVWHAKTFRGTTPDGNLDSLEALATFYGRYPDRDWARVGTELGRRLAGQRVRIAADAVGAIPYFSRIETVDTLGLNDAWIARHGTTAPADFLRPGHRRAASVAQLRERGVHFLLGHPTLLSPAEFRSPSAPALLGTWVENTLGFGDAMPDRLTITLIPIDERQGLVAWYLTRTAELDALVTTWPSVELSR